MTRKNNIRLLVLFHLVFCFNACSQEYYSVSNFGKLKLYSEDSLFSFHYWNCGIDSGTYSVKNDTVFLNSIIPVVTILKINEYQENNYYFDFVSWIEIYDSGGCLIRKATSKIDTINNEVKINNIEFKKGYVLNFSIFGMPRKLIWHTDTINSCYFEMDQRHGRRIYFDNYPLLMQDNYLLPFDEEANEYFRTINGFEFLPMKKGNKNKKYKTYLSGFGEIH